MQTLPVETLHQIFRLACTDGGYTGCSLSQTSRAVRAASQRVRFHSVALFVGSDRFESFFDLYWEQGMLEGAKILHLHLEGDEDDEYHLDPGEDYHTRSTPSYNESVTLLHLVADDLVSLVLPSVLMMPPPTDGAVALTDRPFPSLKALIVNIPNTTRDSVLQSPAISPLFPALTHVHIVMDPFHLYHRLPFSTWYTHAPRCTHLRISFDRRLGAMEELRCLLGTPTYPHRVGRRSTPVLPPPDVRSWPSVRHIAIQTLPDRESASTPYAQLEWLHRDFLSELSWMVEWANKEKIFESARLLSSELTRTNREWHAVVREAWERVVTEGVDGKDWLTLGQKCKVSQAEPTGSELQG